MKINSNSLSARFYVWFYNLEFYQDLPKNLCPFFWKLVIAYLFIIPVFLITFPGIIFNKILNQKKIYHSGELYGFTLLSYLCIYFSLSLLSVPFALIVNHLHHSHSGFLHTLQLTGVAIIMIGIFIGLYHLFFVIKARIKNRLNKNNYEHRNDEKTPNILVEFVKAKYNKYCPSIEWENMPEKKSYEETYEIYDND